MRFGYFCINFFVKGSFTLGKVEFVKFSFVSPPIGVVLEFCQGDSKN
jgi:hypothetical protein